MGRTAENGRGSEGVSARRADPHGKREEALGGVPGIRERSQQDHGELLLAEF